MEHGNAPAAGQQLAACPFCGGEASATGVIRYHETHEAWFSDGTRALEAFFCNCVSCGIDNKGLIGHQTRDKAIAAWNRRATLPAAAACAEHEEPSEAQIVAALKAASLLVTHESVKDMRKALIAAVLSASCAPKQTDGDGNATR